MMTTPTTTRRQPTRQRLHAICGFVALVVVVVAGCGARSAPQGGDEDMQVGSDTSNPRGDASSSCSGLSEAACGRNSDCNFFQGCASCSGPAGPGQCLPKGSGFACPAIGCISCAAITNPAQCSAQPGCEVQSCPDCTTGQPHFVSCLEIAPGAPPPACICPTSQCAQFQDAASCAAAQNLGCVAAQCQGCNNMSTFGGCYNPAIEQPPFCNNGGACLEPCSQLSESQCQQRADCRAEECAICGGPPSFAGCADANSPPVNCATPSCPACIALDEADCWANPGCRADYCTGCSGNDSFLGCNLAISMPATCPALDCAMPDCGGIPQSTCDGRPGCHSVFDFGGQYERCATGSADCSSPQYCRTPGPACPQGFKALIRDGCTEGCAPTPSECQ